MTKTTTKTEQGNLDLPGKGESYKQGRIDGKGNVRETCPKALQDAADHLSGKKVEEARAKDNTKKAAEKLLELMDKAGKTSLVYFDTERNCKRRVNIIEAAEKLKFQDAGVND